MGKGCFERVIHLHCLLSQFQFCLYVLDSLCFIFSSIARKSPDISLQMLQGAAFLITTYKEYCFHTSVSVPCYAQRAHVHGRLHSLDKWTLAI